MPPPSTRRINWPLVLTVISMATSWLGGAAVGAWQFNDRVTKLETSRTHDVEQRREEREAERLWRQRLEDKVDRILERRQ